MNDLDYINFVSDQDWQWKTRHNELTQKNSISFLRYPNKLENKIFVQGDDLKFTDASMAVQKYCQATAVVPLMQILTTMVIWMWW